MMRSLPFYLILFFSTVCSFGQDTLSISVLNSDYYRRNPVEYLSSINPAKVSSRILMDRTYFDSLYVLANGTTKVATISSTFWYEIFNKLKYTNYDTTRLPDPVTIDQIVDGYYESEKIYSIGILDFQFNRITQASLNTGAFVQLDSSLQDISATPNSFSTDRIVAASCMSENLQGDEIVFMVSDLLYYSNIPNQSLTSIEIDFDNGQGYQAVTFDNTITINYGEESEFLLIKVKLTYENTVTHLSQSYYAHSTVFRTGSETVPQPDSIADGSNPNARTNDSRVKWFYYPEGEVIMNTVCVPHPLTGEMRCRNVPVVGGENLEIHMLLAPGNTSGKLRSPFIVTDGFDPGNKRDYFANRIKGTPTISFFNFEFTNVPRGNDYRGLYELLNGDPSPWYDGQPSANFINLLRADGYDVVIINYMEGDVSLTHNASILRSFFNNVLNSPLYRDSQTEEAILVGPSMGGLITRMVLAEMENAGEPHFVKTWYSFDAPHTGANIPLSLQHVTTFLAKINDGQGLFKKLEEAKRQFKEGEAILRTTAARQMLSYYYTKTTYTNAYPHNDYNDLHAHLDNVGYPRQTRNYAISNGGLSKLYPQDGTDVIEFRAPSAFWFWALGKGLRNSSGSFELYAGSRWGGNENMMTGNTIGFDNAMGGWTSVLYKLNCDNANKAQKAETNTPFVKSAFIVTTSAFGVPMTQQNVYNSWQDYTADQTPFDVIKGMNQIENEEHVRISPSTANWVINELRTDFINSTRPRIRPGEPLSQTIKGQVAYRTKETITFAGSQNSFIIDNTAKVEITAGTSITWSPGLHAKPGSEVSLKIATVNFGTSARVASSKPIRFAYSPYLGQVERYTESEQTNEIDHTAFTAFPNPFDMITTLSLPASETYRDLQVINAMGVSVFSDNSVKPGPYILNVSQYARGFYSVLVRLGNGKVRVIKILKQ
jgi:hypothetical protein